MAKTYPKYCFAVFDPKGSTFLIKSVKIETEEAKNEWTEKFKTDSTFIKWLDDGFELANYLMREKVVIESI